MTPAADAGKGGGRAASAAAAPAAAFGLVPSSTTDRKDELTIDRFGSRYRRLKKNVITSCRLLRDSRERDGVRYFLAMLTLTYAPGIAWKPTHLPELHKRVREYLRYRNHRYSYVWVCELQRRGAPHYHILIWLPWGIRLPKADLFGWWPHGSTNIEKVEKPIGYMIKYLSKTQDDIHRYAKGQRTHGSGGLDDIDKIERRWWLSPSYVRKHWPDKDDDVRPAAGGGWVARRTGEWIDSPWEFVCFIPFVGAVIRRRAARTPAL